MVLMFRFPILSGLCIFVALASPQGVIRADERAVEAPLIISSIVRPPYYYPLNGQPAGFLLERTERVLARAGIPHSYRFGEPNGILNRIRANIGPICSPGWFRNPERERFAQFTPPIYRDQPLVVLTRREQAERIREAGSIQRLFGIKQLAWGRPKGFAYGEFIDGLAETLQPRIVSTTKKQTSLVRMLQARHIDYMLIAPEEIDALIVAAGVDQAKLAQVTLSDAPQGNLRYLICSKSVTTRQLQLLSNAVAAELNVD